MRKFKGFANSNNTILIIFILYMLRMNISDLLDNPIRFCLDFLYILPGIIIGITIHEFAHAYSAYKLGDQTPKLGGRVSLNPIRHIDLFGFLALLFAHFGWGKAVQVNPFAFRHRRRDMLIVSFAGVVVNFILAFLFCGLYMFIYGKGIVSYPPAEGLPYILMTTLFYVVYMNLVLCIFNLIPIPPLDGFGVITEIFNLRRFSWYDAVYSYGFIALFVFMGAGLSGRVIGTAIDKILDVFMDFYSGIFW